MVLWEVGGGEEESDGERFDELAAVAREVLRANVRRAEAKARLTEPWDGVDIGRPDALQLTFVRRALYPW